MLEEFPQSMEESPFVHILNGAAAGNVIARDDEVEMALIQSLHPEAAIHWLAIPFEPIPSIEELEEANRERFLQLLDFAIRQTRAQVVDYPELENGFTIKFHLGSFETVPHAKLHILSAE